MAKLMQTKQLIAVLIFSSLFIQLFMFFVVSSFLQIGHIISLSFFVKFFMVDVVSAAPKLWQPKKKQAKKTKSL